MTSWPKPTPKQINALKADPTRAGEFDRKFGPSASAQHLRGSVTDALLLRVLKAQEEGNAMLEELLQQSRAPRRVLRDDNGDVVGVAIDDDVDR